LQRKSDKPIPIGLSYTVLVHCAYCVAVCECDGLR